MPATQKDAASLDAWACDGGLPGETTGLEPGIKERIAEGEAKDPDIGVEYFPYEPHGFAEDERAMFFDQVETKWLTLMDEIDWSKNALKEKFLNFPDGKILLWSEEVRLHPLYTPWSEAVARNLESHGQPGWTFQNKPSEIVCFHMYCKVYMEWLTEIDAMPDAMDEETQHDDLFEKDSVLLEQKQHGLENDSVLIEQKKREAAAKWAHEPEADLRMEYFGSDIDSDDGMEMSPLRKRPKTAKKPKGPSPKATAPPPPAASDSSQKPLPPADATVLQEQKGLGATAGVTPADVMVSEEQKASHAADVKAPEEQKVLEAPAHAGEIKTPDKQKVLEPLADVKPAEIKTPDEQNGFSETPAEVKALGMEQKVSEEPKAVVQMAPEEPKASLQEAPTADVKVPAVRGSDHPLEPAPEPSKPAAEMKEQQNQKVLQPVQEPKIPEPPRSLTVPEMPPPARPQKPAVVEIGISKAAAPKAPAALQTAVAVSRAATSPPNADNRPVSSTLNRNEYMVFLRRGKQLDEDDPAKKMFDTGGHQGRELFKLWMQSSKDFAQVQVEVSRKRTERTRANSKEGGMTRLEISNSGKYTEAEVTELVERLERQGHFIHDPNFPDRKDKYLYFVHQDISMSRQSEREDSTTLTGTLQVQDQETLGQILHEGELADNSSPGRRTILPSSSAAALPAPLPGAPPGDGNGDTTTGRRKGAAKPKGTKNRRKSAAVETGTEPETGDGDGKG